MSVLISLLNQMKHEEVEGYPVLVEAALTEAMKLYEEQKESQDEIERLGQIIRDVRERDANKKCICRGY